LAAALLFGGVNVAARAAITMGLDPLWAAGLSYVSGGVLLSPWLRKGHSFDARDRRLLSVVVLAGAVAAPLLLYEGLARPGAVDNVASTPLAQRHDPRAVIAWKTLLGGLVVLALSVVLAPRPSLALAPALALALAAGVVGVAVSSVLFYAALARIGATRTVVL